MPDTEGFGDDPMDTKKITLAKRLYQTATRTIQSFYDFGGECEHSIWFEWEGKGAQGVTYPQLLKDTGACPPGDVGGAWGYAEFFEVVADSEQHEDMVH